MRCIFIFTMILLPSVALADQSVNLSQDELQSIVQAEVAKAVAGLAEQKARDAYRKVSKAFALTPPAAPPGHPH